MDKYILYNFSRTNRNQCNNFIFKYNVLINELEFTRWFDSKIGHINSWSNLVNIFIIINSLCQIFWKKSTFNMGSFLYSDYSCRYINLRYLLIEYIGFIDDNFISICILNNEWASCLVVCCWNMCRFSAGLMYTHFMGICLCTFFGYAPINYLYWDQQSLFYFCFYFHDFYYFLLCLHKGN